MIRGALVTVATISLAIGVAPGALAGGSAPPGDDGVFAIPAERIAELEAAGLGDLVAIDYPDQPADVPWPTAEWPLGVLPDEIDAAALDRLLDEAFSPAHAVDAAVVVLGGEVVVQRYGTEVDRRAPHISWSMAKSITQAMIGILVADGQLDVWASAPVDEWSDPADPRHEITIDDLLGMRSGLEWTEGYSGDTDVTDMLFGEGAANRGAFAAARPLDDEPGEVWEYSTGTSMILANVIAGTVGHGADGVDWAQQELFGPLGISTVRHTLDDSGAMSGGSMIDMMALDFARFGYLYLRGGEWDGEQIVPEAWVDYARLPRPDTPNYGAHWWVWGTDTAEQSAYAFAAQGFNGQYIVVVPSADLVVVVLANDSGDAPDVLASGLVELFATA